MALSINLKATLILIFCLSDRVYAARNSKLEQKVDALDKLFRTEMYLMNEKVEVGRHERDMILEQLNQTLDLLENLARDGGNTKEETPTTIDQTYVKTLSSKIDENNMVVDRIKRGLLDEKKARKRDATAVINQLNIIQERQTEILKNQADLASGITDIFDRIITLESATNVTNFQSEIILLSLNEGETKFTKKLDSATQNLTTTVDVINKQIEDMKKDFDHRLHCDNHANLNDCLQKYFTDLEDHLKSIKRTLGPVHLRGGESPYQGRVEIFYMGKTATVCDDDWDDNDARVVCRMLGFSGGTAFQGLGGTNGHQYGEGTGDILLDNVQCTGSEDTLFHCKHNGLGVENCNHNEDAGVRCNP